MGTNILKGPTASLLVGCLSAQCLIRKHFYYALWDFIKQEVGTEGYATTEQLKHATRDAFQNITRRVTRCDATYAQYDGVHTQVSRKL
jgi:uncharacterized protein YbjQ (UPF0145 family)